MTLEDVLIRWQQNRPVCWFSVLKHIICQVRTDHFYDLACELEPCFLVAAYGVRQAFFGPFQTRSAATVFGRFRLRPETGFDTLLRLIEGCLRRGVMKEASKNGVRCEHCGYCGHSENLKIFFQRYSYVGICRKYNRSILHNLFVA